MDNFRLALSQMVSPRSKSRTPEDLDLRKTGSAGDIHKDLESKYVDRQRPLESSKKLTHRVHVESTGTTKKADDQMRMMNIGKATWQEGGLNVKEGKPEGGVGTSRPRKIAGQNKVNPNWNPKDLNRKESGVSGWFSAWQRGDVYKEVTQAQNKAKYGDELNLKKGGGDTTEGGYDTMPAKEKNVWHEPDLSLIST